MNTDLSVAPEIAQLAGPFVPAGTAATAPRTDGRIAGDLSDLAAAPQRWWDLVRFDSAGPVRVPVPDAPGSWLLVLPPGATAGCDCRLATALAGEAVELPGAVELSRADAAESARAAAPRPLRPGRVRVHGALGPGARPHAARLPGAGAAHRVLAVGPGYSVTLHWDSAPHPL